MPTSTTVYLRIIFSLAICALGLTPLLAQNIAEPWTQETLDSNPRISALLEYNGRVFAGTGNAGLFYSDDSGDNWSTLRDQLPMRRIYSLHAIESTVFATGRNATFRSTDGGDSWSESLASSGTALSGILDIAAGESSLFAVNSNSLFRSDDMGGSWQTVPLLGKPTDETLKSIETHNSKIYVATNNSTFTLDVQSSTLQAIDAPLNNSIVSMLKTLSGRLYLAGFNSSSGAALFHLNDDGDDWISTGNNLPPGITVFDILAEDDEFYISSSHGMFTSTDALDWSAIANPLDVNYYQYSTISNGFLLMGTFGNGVHRYEIAEPDGGFTLVNNNLTSWSTNRVWRTTERLIAESMGLGTRNKTPGTDEEWTKLTTDDSVPLLFASEILPFNDEWLMAAKYLYSSADGGRSWQLTNPIPLQELVQNLVIANGRIVGFTHAHVVEYGEDKSTTKHEVPTAGGFSAVVAQGNAIFGAVSDGRLFQSQDFGSSWNQIGTGLPNQGILHMWANSELIFAATQTEIYKSLDGGLTWAGVNIPGLGSNNVVRELLGYNEHVYVLTLEGIQFSDFNSSSWTKLSLEGLDDNVGLSSMAIHEGQIYVGTFGDGVYETTLQEVISSVTVDPLNILNLQISPNPVKPNSKLVYTLEQKAQVEINVFDLLGNSVVEPMRGYRDAGTFTQELNAEGLTSGQYILVVRAGEETVAQQFAVVK